MHGNRLPPMVGLQPARAKIAATVRTGAFALASIPLIGLQLIAIDYGHALKIRSEIQSAADAAVAAVAGSRTMLDQALAGVARATLDSHLRRELKGLPFALITAQQSLRLRIETSVASRVGALLGKTAFHFDITSDAIRGNGFTRQTAETIDDATAELLLERAATGLDFGGMTESKSK